MIFNTWNKSNWTTILIRLSTKCSSNCVNCELPYIKNNEYKDLWNLDDILKFCSLKCNKNFTIGLLWYNLLNIEKYSKFYGLINIYSDFEYSIQLGLNDLLNNYKEIINILNKYNNLNFWIQKIIKSKQESLTIIKTINLLIEKKLKINISFILDFKKFEFMFWLLKSKYKFSNNKKSIIFYIWKSQVEFENDLWFWNIENFEYNNCIWLWNFSLEKNKIFIRDDIEITLNWDIKFHLNNFCNQWIKKISSIYKEDNEILNDFKLLEKELGKRNLEKNKCKNCLKNPINFN